ncbi:MAG TPA: hypothetical protein VG432_14235 [Gemmatimonadaceae bacterium]|nr:hypothetical protein [Gemmatimonadaceae bacterium]
MKLLTCAVLACVVLLPGCGQGTEPKPKSSNFTADVVGDERASLSGEAGFVITPTAFVITLASAANRNQVIQFNRLGGAPAAGSYSLAYGPAASGIFVGMYLGGAQANYVSTDGVLTVTSASADRISGSFTFAAAGGTTGSAHVSIDGRFDARRLAAP